MHLKENWLIRTRTGGFNANKLSLPGSAGKVKYTRKRGNCKKSKIYKQKH